MQELSNAQSKNVKSIDDKLSGGMTEMDLKMKSLELKNEQNIEKNIESTNNLAHTVQELSKSQNENLLSLKSEISIKIDEMDHHNKSLIANIEERLATDTENKITQLGKSFMKNVVMIIMNNDTICHHLLVLFKRHPSGKSLEKSVEEMKDCLDEVNDTFEKEKEENLRQLRSLGNYSDQIWS